MVITLCVHVFISSRTGECGALKVKKLSSASSTHVSVRLWSIDPLSSPTPMNLKKIDLYTASEE